MSSTSLTKLLCCTWPFMLREKHSGSGSLNWIVHQRPLPQPISLWEDEGPYLLFSCWPWLWYKFVSLKPIDSYPCAIYLKSWRTSGNHLGIHLATQVCKIQFLSKGLLHLILPFACNILLLDLYSPRIKNIPIASTMLYLTLRPPNDLSFLVPGLEGNSSFIKTDNGCFPYIMDSYKLIRYSPR